MRRETEYLKRLMEDVTGNPRQYDYPVKDACNINKELVRNSLWPSVLACLGVYALIGVVVLAKQLLGRNA